MSPEIVYLASTAALATLLRSRWPWRRLGGPALGVAAVVAVVVGWLRGVFSQGHTADAANSGNAPAAFAISLAVVAFGAATWSGLHRRQQARQALDAARRSGTALPASPGEELVPGRGLALPIAVALGVVALAGFLPVPVPAPPAWPFEGLRWLTEVVGLPAVVLACSTVGLTLWSLPWLIPAEEDALPSLVFGAALLGPLPLVSALVAGSATPLETASDPLSLRLWVDGLGVQPPGPWLLREAPGLLLILAVFVVLPLALPRLRATRGIVGPVVRRLGRLRYAFVAFVAASLLWLPLRIAARMVFAVREIVTPPGPWP